MDARTASLPTLVPATAITGLPLERLGDIEGVAHRVLWRDATSVAGILTVEAGHHLGAHTHRANHHHIWVLDGEVAVLGSVLTPGSYAHIPAGVEHDIDARATGGCTVYYLYVRQDE